MTRGENLKNEIEVTIQNGWAINGVGQPLEKYELTVETYGDTKDQPVIWRSAVRFSLEPGESTVITIQITFPEHIREFEAVLVIQTAEPHYEPRPWWQMPVTLQSKTRSKVLALVGEQEYR